MVGPTAIGNGRSPYNNAIQSTASQQTLLNIVRVHNAESPQFVDVSEVDEVTTVGSSVSGGASNIGAGAIGAITGVGSYQEAPTVRYLPLLGQALIAQVSTPIAVESLTNLISSDWDLGAVLTLGVDRITPGYRDYDAAVDALIDLDKYGAIIVTATQSTASAANSKSKALLLSPVKDTLTIYLKSKDVSPAQSICDGGNRGASQGIVKALWARLKNIYGVGGQNDTIPLTIKSKASPFVTARGDGAPLLATRSALGVLKAAAESESPTIAFLSEPEVREIIRAHEDEGNCAEDFYALDPRSYHDSEYSERETPETLDWISNYLRSKSTSTRTTLYPLATRLTSKQLELEEGLVNARRFMLVAMSATPPADAYTSVRRGDTWFSILDGDRISKRTLALINQFDTIQAVPSATPPLTPTISVGAKS